MPLSCVVELGLTVIGRGHHCPDGTGVRVHGYERRCWWITTPASQFVDDRISARLLELGLDRRVDPHSPLANGCNAVLSVELLGHIIEEEALPAGGEVGVAPRVQRVILCAVGLRLRDVMGACHRVQNLGATGLRTLRIEEWVVLRWGLRKPGQQGALSERQVLNRFVEEHSCCGLNAYSGLPANCAVSNIVQVAVEDPRLTVLLLKLKRPLGLFDFAVKRLG